MAYVGFELVEREVDSQDIYQDILNFKNVLCKRFGREMNKSI